MKEYRELTIAGSRDVLIATMAEIEHLLTDGWKRNQRIEEDGRSRAGLKSNQLRFCFTCTSTPKRKGALLVLMSDHDDNLILSNIVPDEMGKLTHDEFNYILEEFLQKFARPAVTTTGATIKTSRGYVTIDDWFSRETADKLRRFLAITRGNISQPADYDQWMAFLVAARREGAQVHGDVLRRWLEEDGECDDDSAQELASEYQTVLDYERSKEELVGA